MQKPGSSVLNGQQSDIPGPEGYGTLTVNLNPSVSFTFQSPVDLKTSV